MAPLHRHLPRWKTNRTLLGRWHLSGGAREQVSDVAPFQCRTIGGGNFAQFKGEQESAAGIDLSEMRLHHFERKAADMAFLVDGVPGRKFEGYVYHGTIDVTIRQNVVMQFNSPGTHSSNRIAFRGHNIDGLLHHFADARCRFDVVGILDNEVRHGLHYAICRREGRYDFA